MEETKRIISYKNEIILKFLEECLKDVEEVIRQSKNRRHYASSLKPKQIEHLNFLRDFLADNIHLKTISGIVFKAIHKEEIVKPLIMQRVEILDLKKLKKYVSKKLKC